MKIATEYKLSYALMNGSVFLALFSYCISMLAKEKKWNPTKNVSHKMLSTPRTHLDLNIKRKFWGKCRRNLVRHQACESEKFF
jgi:hypothetical protein